MVMVEMTLARLEVARATSEHLRFLFWALVKPQNAEIWHEEGSGHDEANGQGGHRLSHGQEHLHAKFQPSSPSL